MPSTTYEYRVIRRFDDGTDALLLGPVEDRGRAVARYMAIP
jgi:hypothetical protein